MNVFQKKIFKWLFIMSILSPIGLFLSEFFKAGDAWGEWDGDTVKELVGYLPKGMEKLSDIWKAPIPDYSFKGLNGDLMTAFSYIFSAFVGMFFCAATSYFFVRILKNVKNR